MALQTKTYTIGDYAWGSWSNSYKLELIITEVSKNDSGNYSTISYEFNIRSGENNRYGPTYTYYGIELNGVKIDSGRKEFYLDFNSKQTLASGITNVYHNSDGTLNMPIHAWIDKVYDYDGSENQWAPPAMSISESMTLTAITRKTCTITYDANGGTGAPSPTTYFYAASGATNLSSTEPIRTGYTFLGWSLDPNATTASYYAGQAWGLFNNGDYTLYAVWRPITYNNSISHWRYVGTGGNNSNGRYYHDSNEDNTFPGTYGQNVVVPADKARSYTGYHSTGYGQSYWGTNTWSSKNFGETFVQPAGAISVEYYYLLNEYTVTYNGNGATGGSTPTSQHTYNIASNLTANGFIRTGYKFNGWNTKANGSGTAYTDKASVKNLTTTHNGNVTLYAQWLRDENIKFNGKIVAKVVFNGQPVEHLIYNGSQLF